MLKTHLRLLGMPVSIFTEMTLLQLAGSLHQGHSPVAGVNGSSLLLGHKRRLTLTGVSGCGCSSEKVIYQNLVWLDMAHGLGYS